MLCWWADETVKFQRVAAHCYKSTPYDQILKTQYSHNLDIQIRAVQSTANCNMPCSAWAYFGGNRRWRGQSHLHYTIGLGQWYHYQHASLLSLDNMSAYTDTCLDSQSGHRYWYQCQCKTSFVNLSEVFHLYCKSTSPHRRAFVSSQPPFQEHSHLTQGPVFCTTKTIGYTQYLPGAELGFCELGFGYSSSGFFLLLAISRMQPQDTVSRLAPLVCFFSLSPRCLGVFHA